MKRYNEENRGKEKSMQNQKWLEDQKSYCVSIEEAACKKLNRPLTDAERQALHGIMSFLFLEAFDRALQATLTVEDAEQWLRGLLKTSKDLSQKREEG